MLNPTKYKISTITATGSINALLNLESFYHNVEVIDDETEDKEDNEGIIFIEFGMKRMETMSRGVHRRSRRKKKNKDKNARRFDNQVTLIFKMYVPDTTQETDNEVAPIHIAKSKEGEDTIIHGSKGLQRSDNSKPEGRSGPYYVNVKVFKNGNIQMTGLKEVDQGIRVIEFVSEQIERIKKIDPSVIAPDPVTLESQAENKEPINNTNHDNNYNIDDVLNHHGTGLEIGKIGSIHSEATSNHDEDALNHHGTGLKGGEVAFGNRRGPSYKIRLINSDFRMGLEIKRDKLNKVMQQCYDVRSSFEPCIYPGVKIQFFWNADKAENVDGKCLCPAGTRCNGKGCGQGVGNCKKITIAVFQSGCIIITGALTTEQIDDAYIFICGVVEKHRSEIEKVRIRATSPAPQARLP
jgi:hypothetical protein